MEINEHIILRIKQFINEKNLSWRGIAARIGVNKQNLYNYRDEKVRVPLELLDQISKRFDVPMTYWFEEDIPNEAHEGKSNYIQLKKNESMKVLQKELDRKQEEIDRLWDQINFLNEQLLKAQGIENDKSKAV